ncbi:MAG: replicative DNA helicase [Chlamydiia bacterium]|nr:replicative DNA helicase [Chlamydiia bacterium]
MDKRKVKVAPNSKESEMMVLGCMLTNVNSLNVACDGLDEFDFYYTEHQTIFRSLKNIYKKDKPADIHIVAEELKSEDKLDAIGGVAYLTTLAQFVGTSAYIEEYIELVKNKSILRQMIRASDDIEKVALNEPNDVHAALDQAQAAFFSIGQNASRDQYIHIKDILSGLRAKSQLPYLKELQERQEQFHAREDGAPSVTGIPSHFLDVDKMINGLAPSNLFILAGRPGMGKTAFALNIAENVCFKNNIPVGIFSLEMSAEQLLHRVICSQAEVESDKIIHGSLDGSEYQRIVETVDRLNKHHMIIDDQAGLKISDLRSRARRMKEVHNIGLLIVDYLQLLSGSSSSFNSDNRQQEISDISRNLKNLARELDIPIICGSQLSRKVEERTGHRPIMSDLRESGSLEQDADIVMLMFRPDYYDPQNKPGQTEIIVAKNRHGQVGTVTLTFRKEYAQFGNYSGSDESFSDENDSVFAPFSPSN